MSVRSGPMRAQNVSFRSKKCLLGVLNHVPVKFGGQASQKTEILGDRTFKAE